MPDDRRYTRTELGVAYGVAAGAVLGPLLMSVLGDPVWIALVMALCLIAGSCWGMLADARSERDTSAEADGDREQRVGRTSDRDTSR